MCYWHNCIIIITFLSEQVLKQQEGMNNLQHRLQTSFQKMGDDEKKRFIQVTGQLGKLEQAAQVAGNVLHQMIKEQSELLQSLRTLKTLQSAQFSFVNLYDTIAGN